MNFEKPKISHPTGTPEKRIVPPYEDDIITKEKYRSFYNLFNGVFDDVPQSIRPTVLDFHGLPPETKEEDILSWAEKKMEIPTSYILDDGKTEESSKFYKELNYSYQTAKNFLVDTLKYSEKEVSIGPSSISSKKDLFDLLNKTIFINGNKGLGKSLLYCRIVKVTLAASETLKHGVKQLKNNTEDFESSMISHPSENTDTPFIKIDESNYVKKFYGAENGNLKGDLTSRGKDQSKVVLRFITREEADAKTALKDGIASRITIEEKRVSELLPILSKWLTEEMKVQYLTIENISFLPENKFNELSLLLEKSIDKNKFTFINAKSDPTSMGNFETLKITGVLDLSMKKENPKIQKFASQFEIQIVKPFNRNEKGKMAHSVFSVLKLVTARTRLDGSCPEHIFNRFVEEASLKSGISEKKIISYLIEENDSPITKIKKKNNKKGESIYIANSVYSRWKKFNWVDHSLVADIEHSKQK